MYFCAGSGYGVRVVKNTGREGAVWGAEVAIVSEARFYSVSAVERRCWQRVWVQTSWTTRGRVEISLSSAVFSARHPVSSPRIWRQFATMQQMYSRVVFLVKHGDCNSRRMGGCRWCAAFLNADLDRGT